MFRIIKTHFHCSFKTVGKKLYKFFLMCLLLSNYTISDLCFSPPGNIYQKKCTPQNHRKPNVISRMPWWCTMTQRPTRTRSIKAATKMAMRVKGGLGVANEVAAFPLIIYMYPSKRYTFWCDHLREVKSGSLVGAKTNIMQNVNYNLSDVFFCTEVAIAFLVVCWLKWFKGAVCRHRGRHVNGVTFWDWKNINRLNITLKKY